MKTQNFQNSPVDENPVYVRLGYYESIESKKNLLSSEMSLLNIIKIARRYNSLKQEELDLKNKIYKAVRELDASLRRTRDTFPFFKVPQITKKEEVKKEIVTKDRYDKDLELQLKEIQDKLKSIGR
jgi:hypothetical protein